jgi:hypothetical protein
VDREQGRDDRPLKAEARGHGDADNITPRAPATVEAAPAPEWSVGYDRHGLSTIFHGEERHHRPPEYTPARVVENFEEVELFAKLARTAEQRERVAGHKGWRYEEERIAPVEAAPAPAEEHPAPVEARSRRRTIDPDKLISGQEAP